MLGQGVAQALGFFLFEGGSVLDARAEGAGCHAQEPRNFCCVEESIRFLQGLNAGQRRGETAARFFHGFHPTGDGRLQFFQSFLPGVATGDATGQFRDEGYPDFISCVPVENDAVVVGCFHCVWIR